MSVIAYRWAESPAFRPEEQRHGPSLPEEGSAEAHEGELSVAPDVLAHLPLAGRVVTGDALYAQRELCRQVMEAGEQYLFMVKGNQPALYADIELLFREPPPGERMGLGCGGVRRPRCGQPCGTWPCGRTAGSHSAPCVCWAWSQPQVDSGGQ